MKYFITILALLFSANLHASPSVSGVNRAAVHNSTITISGEDFGAKNPAPPLWWDNGEGATVEDDSIMRSGEMTWVTSTLTGSNKHYNDAHPYNDGHTASAARIKYHAANFRSIAAPHSKSSKFIAGNHDYNDSCDHTSASTQNVALNVSDQSTHAIWYVSYYLRLDPSWPTDWDSEGNYKFFSWERGEGYSIYDGSGVKFAYDNLTDCNLTNFNRSPVCGSDFITGRIAQVLVGSSGCDTSTTPVWVTASTGVKNPSNQWTKNEHLYKNNGGSGDVFVWKSDNVTSWDIALDSGCYLNDTAHANNPGGVTIGGFWRFNYDCYNSEDNYGENAWRYFDDVYVDTTFSRVMICNDSTYSSATICEPQIPTVWDIGGGSITVTVNQGALSLGTNYLYVFDSDNEASSGYAVILSSGDQSISGVDLKGVNFQ